MSALVSRRVPASARPLVGSATACAGAGWPTPPQAARPRGPAVGQRFQRPWRSESFLLTEPLACEAGLAETLMDLSWQADGIQSYRRLLREAGIVLRRLHESSCYLPVHAGGDLARPFGVA